MLFAICLPLWLVACGDDDPGTDAGSGDAGADASTADAGTDADTNDAGTDADTNDAGADGSMDSGTDAAQPRGALAITVTLPSGVTPSIEVTGPDSFQQTVTETATLQVSPGTYQITATAVRQSGTIVDSVFDPAVSIASVTVVENTQSDVTVTYSRRVGSGALWLANADGTANNVIGLSASQLVSGTDITPDVVLTSPVTPTLESQSTVAFDGAGNLWVGLCAGTNPMLVRYAAADLATSGTPTPDIQINGSAAVAGLCALDLAFAEDGRLAIAADSDGVVLYSAAQLQATGTPTPIVVGTADITSADGIAFDIAGNVWVADYSGSQVLRYSPGQLTSSGSPTAATTWTDTLIDGPVDIDFDASGTMWLTDYDLDAIYVLTSSQLTQATFPTPTRTITSGDLNGPEAPAFDNAGNLWVPNWQGDSLIMLSAADLATGGTISASVTITSSTMVEPYTVAFSPPPSGLPIFTP